jgi:hypothetical protein
VVGRNISNLNQNTFSIFCNNQGNCLSIDTNKTVTISGALDVKSPTYLTELTVSQRIYGNILNLTGTVEANGIITARSTSAWVICVASLL